MNGNRDALAAKCRCLKGKLLTKEQYTALASKPGVAEAVEYLRSETSYSELLSDVEPLRIHRARLEQLLENHMLDVYSRLYAFTSGVERKFIGILIEEFTLRCLLDAIRATEYDDSMEFYSIPALVRDHSKIDFARIFRTDSKEEILDALKGSEYYDTLRHVMSDSSSFDDIEAELMREYYKKLIRSTGELFDNDEQKEILDLLHTRIDLVNISVILRMRRFKALRSVSDRAALELTEVLPRLIPIFKRLKKADIASLCEESLTIPETVERFSQIERRQPSELDENSSTGEYGSRLVYKSSRRLSGSGRSFGVALGYLTLLRTETDNLVYIIEALRYGVSTERITDKIIV